MTTERFDIVIREDGARVVKRNLDDIARSSDKVSDSVAFLKKTLAGLGIGFVVVETLRLADTYTNLQNKLRTTGLEGVSLNAVWKELLKSSNDTRQSMEGSVTIYSRLASTANRLGMSQRDLITFTDSLNTAVALSGATATEAEAAIIQLSQGMGAGVLRGDELRSVLEQLPSVADVIAKEMGVTRGELKKLGEQGKISADIIFKAFANARGELKDRFARSIPTIGQSFQVLKNQLMTAIGEIDKQMGISNTISGVLLTLAKNMDALALAVVNLGKALVVAGIAYATFWAVNKAGQLAATINAWWEFRNAVSAGIVVVLGSAEAERQKALAMAASAAASVTAANRTIAAAAAEATKTQAALASITATQAQMVAERELELVRFRAQINDIGRAKSMTRLAELRRAEVAITELVTAAQAQNASAQAALTAAQNAGSAASARLTAAQGGYAAAQAAAAGSTTLFGQALTFVKAQVLRLWAMITAHPLGALLTAVAAIIAALTVWRDEIDMGVDSITTLGDYMRAIGTVAKYAFDLLLTAANETFGPLIKWVKSWGVEFDFSIYGMMKASAWFVDTFIGLMVGMYNASITLFKGLPAALGDIFTQALNLTLKKIGDFVNAAGQLLSTVTEFAGLGKIATIDLQIDNEFSGQAKQLGADVNKAMADGIKGSTYAQDALHTITKLAQSEAQKRVAAEKAKADLDKKGQKTATGVVDETEAAKVRKLQKELNGLLNTIAPIAGAKLEMARATDLLQRAEEKHLITEKEHKLYLELLKQHYKDILDPLGKLNREIDQSTRLLGLNVKQREIEGQMLQATEDLRKQGVILTEEENAALRAKLTALQALEAATQRRDALLAGSVDARQAEIDQLNSIQSLLADTGSGFTKADATNALIQMNPDMFKGTQEAYESQIVAVDLYYQRIDELRHLDLISEQTATQMKYKAELASMEARTANTRSFFSELSGLSSSGNRKIAEIGQKAAIVTATIDGVLAVQKALASAPPPANYAIAAAVAAKQAINVQNIASQPLPGYKTGGEFMVGGTGGADSQLVAFRASPDERVKIETPAQQRKNDQKGGTTNQTNVSVPVRVVNVIDPAETVAAMNTSEGERVILNTIQRNPDTVRRLLNA